MFQSFAPQTQVTDGPPRLAALRHALKAQGVDGFLVPRTDRFQGEYVAPYDERLAWLTGFTGSAGMAVVLPDVAGVFVDGRYRLQLRAQVDGGVFTPVEAATTPVADWIIGALSQGGIVGFDPWLHTAAYIKTLENTLKPQKISLRAIENPIDTLWENRPSPSSAPARAWPEHYAGRTAQEKIALCINDLRQSGHDCTVITQADSICWLLNLRGGDVAHTPVMQAMGILHQTGAIDLFVDQNKLSDIALPEGITVHPPDRIGDVLHTLRGVVRVDPTQAPFAVTQGLHDTAHIAQGADPCLMPKACKHPAEITATRAAHLRDGAAVCKFLHWFDETAPQGGLTEIDCARAMEQFRAQSGLLRDISFDTIAGAGANGAIVHYRVTEATNAPVKPGHLFLIDSGGQYEDGTTDITRTIPAGDVGQTEKTAFTQVLRGLIAMHLARFPTGVAGAHLDALARAPLWAAGRDFDYGTGHGVGVYLGVHEGPQRISRTSTTPLKPGMIVSLEPGYYREGAFGIRIENLAVVAKAPALPDGDARPMLQFDTLTYAPIDRRLIQPDLLTQTERAWLNSYHTQVLECIEPQLAPNVAAWLKHACTPI